MTDNADAPKDPSQLVPPYVDSGLDYHGFKVNDLLYGVPGAGVVGASGLAALFGAPLGPSLVGAGVGVLGGLGAIGLAVSSGEYSTGLDRIKTPLAYVKAKRGFPKSGDEAATVHGVKRIHADGTAEMDDGRLVAMARISGRNTTMQETSDAREMIGRIRGELDQHVSDFNFRLFSTALEVDPRDVTEKYRAKLYSSEYAGEEWKLARESSFGALFSGPRTPIFRGSMLANGSTISSSRFARTKLRYRT